MEDADVDYMMVLQREVSELRAENERLRADNLHVSINDLRKAIEIAELMFWRFKGKITGDEAAAMMRASIETTLRVRAQLSK